MITVRFSTRSRLLNTCLWSHVVWSATESARCLLAKNALFAHAEVSDLYMTVTIQHHVVELQVSVNKYRITFIIIFICSDKNT